MKTISALLVICAYAGTPAVSQETHVLPGTSAISPTAVMQERAVSRDTSLPPPEFFDVDAAPEIIDEKEPVYPEAALKARVQGIVRLRIWVDKSGQVRDVKIASSPSELLNQAAIIAAWGYRFRPASVKGKPVDFWADVMMYFGLSPNGNLRTAMNESEKKMRAFITDVLESRVPSFQSAIAYYPPNAHFVQTDGGMILLDDAVNGQRSGLHSVEEPDRKVSKITFCHADKRGTVYYYAFQTVSRKGRSGPHFHSIVTELDSTDTWHINFWHVLQDTRKHIPNRPCLCPLPGKTAADISSDYEEKTHPILNVKRIHAGVDFLVPEGTPVHAAADGTVISVGQKGGFGLEVVVDHGNSYRTLYAHLSKSVVVKGTKVKVGQKIAFSGRSGLVSEPKLHYEVLKGDKNVDPRGFMLAHTGNGKR